MHNFSKNSIWTCDFEPVLFLKRVIGFLNEIVKHEAMCDKYFLGHVFGNGGLQYSFDQGFPSNNDAISTAIPKRPLYFKNDVYK